MRKQMYLKSIFLALAFSCSSVALAGVVFVPPPGKSADSMENEDFPESHFGSGGFGVGDGFAARQVNEMEAPDEETGRRAGPTRGIASVGNNPNSGAIAESPILTTQSAASQEIPQSLVARKGVQEVSVIASDLGYFPKTIFVSRDVPVRMFVTGASKNTLCIMMDSFQVRKQVKAQKIEEITFVPSVPGKYRFYCPVNGMEGTMVVKELSSFAQQEEASPALASAQAPAEAPVTGSVSGRVPAASGRTVPAITNEWHSAIDPNESNGE